LSDEGALLDEIIATRSVAMIYQPVVELDTGTVVAWEALARGPKGSALEFPDRLFGTAARLGRTTELDHVCRAAAVEGAIAAGLGRKQELFVNVEPETAGAEVPDFLLAAREQAQMHLRPTYEITERTVTENPAELVALVALYRERNWGLAFDDVGLDGRSIALIPLLRPDVIKLDMSFVQQPLTRERARVVHAVMAEAERTGARVVAEGIETQEQVEVAKALGADLGQGWHFGRPGPLEPHGDTLGTGRTRVVVETVGGTPFQHLSHRRPVRRGTMRQLLQMSYAIEDVALALGASAVLLRSFQEAKYFTREISERYAALARDLAFVGVLAEELGSEPAPGVHGAKLSPSDALRGEWDVVVLGPHFAGAFVAHDLGDQGDDASRRFDYIVTHNRDLVGAAATGLMQKIAPWSMVRGRGNSSTRH
jgi:EAL domain-containing protein (putative c-di-GMP-specific phosphodiesterase class I)